MRLVQIAVHQAGFWSISRHARDGSHSTSFDSHISPLYRNAVGGFGNNESTSKKKGFLGEEIGRKEREEPEAASLSPKGQREIGVAN